MKIRQSDLKTWAKCPLIYRFQQIDGLQREQSGSLTFGSIMHVCVEYLEINRDLAGAIAMFYRLWDNPLLLGAEYKIDYYVRGKNWKKYYDEGPELIKLWWSLYQWDADTVLAREHHFEVPIGDGHILSGTADKVVLRLHPKWGWVVLIVDYKTNNKVPTYEYIDDDLQFSAYGYASLHPDFWTGIENGAALFERTKLWPRMGEWVSLTASKRLETQPKRTVQYNRLISAVNNFAASVQALIFVANISGETCRYCEFRKVCGLPKLDDETGLPVE